MNERDRLYELFDDYLNTIEFDIYYDEESECYRLQDLQGAYLGGIGGDEFYYLWDVVDRLDTYTSDYYECDLREEIGTHTGKIPEYGEWSELVEIARNTLPPCYWHEIDVFNFVCNEACRDDITLEGFMEWRDKYLNEKWTKKRCSAVAKCTGCKYLDDKDKWGRPMSWCTFHNVSTKGDCI